MLGGLHARLCHAFLVVSALLQNYRKTKNDTQSRDNPCSAVTIGYRVCSLFIGYFKYFYFHEYETFSTAVIEHCVTTFDACHVLLF